MSVSDTEIQVLLTADATQLQAGMQQAATATQTAVQQQMAAFGELDALLEGHTATIEELIAQEQALDVLQQAGMVSAEELAGAFQALSAAEVQLAATTEVATAAQTESNAAFTVTGGAARELGVMIGELARGNYTRLEGSTITLANRTGLLSSALSAVLSPLGLLTVVAAAVGYSIFEAGQTFEQMEGTVLATGEAAGYTAGQLVGMADKIGDSTGSISTATEAVQKLAESGRFAGQNLQLVATAAADMASLTGESIQTCIAQIEKLQEDPLKAVAKLNDQFHFLTVSEYEQMEQLAKSGDTMGAAQIAYEAMASSMQGRTDTLNQHVNVLVSNFRKLKTAWTEDMQALDVDLGGGDDSERLNIQVQLLNNLKEQDAEAQKMGSGSLPEITAELQKQTQVVNTMQAQFRAQEQAASAVGDAAQKSAAQIDQMAKAAKNGGDRQATEQDKQDLEEMQVARTVSLGEEKAYWENIASSAQQGSDEYRQAIQQLIEIKNKQAEADKEAARQSVEAQKQQDSAVMNSLEIQRAATQQYSAQRTAIDEQIVQRAEQLYGQDSEQYKRAIEQKVSDDNELASHEKELAAKKLEDDKATDAADYASARATTQQKMADYQEEYRAHQISGQQFLADEKAVNQEALADFEQYINKKKALDQGNIKALEDDQKEWVTGSAAILKQFQQDNNEVSKTIQQDWNRTSTSIANEVGRGFTQIIFSNQSMSQKLQQEAEQLAEHMIQSLVTNVVKHFLIGEAQKTAATVAGNAQRNATTSASAVAGLAQSAGMDETQIFNSAKTAAANAYASASAIPVIGWIMGPIAAAAAFTGVEAYGNLASAAGGWDNVPADQLAMIHKNEMILPAHVASYVRQGASANATGGSNGATAGATQNIHVHANDTKSFGQMLQRDPSAFAKAAKRAMNPGGKRR